MQAANTMMVEHVCDCGEVFQGTARRKLCDPCRTDRRRDFWRRKNRSRLGYIKAVRAFPISELGERDRWTCWLCGGGVDRALGDRHPMMPSYDHVIPTSLGGSDEPENLKLAHLVCNIRRGNREWLDVMPGLNAERIARELIDQGVVPWTRSA